MHASSSVQFAVSGLDLEIMEIEKKRKLMLARPCNGDTDPQPHLQSHDQSNSLHNAMQMQAQIKKKKQQLESQFILGFV